MALLTISQQNTIKSIRLNWAKEKKVSTNKTNFEKLQEEIENNELMKLLGSAFLYDIQQNPTDQKYIDLLDGKEFIDCDGNPNRFRGIKYQLAYYNYAQYLSESTYQDTYTGLIEKNRNETQTASAGVMKNQQKRWREIGLNDFELMKEFLNENYETYPLWNCTNKRKAFEPKINTLRKTYK